MYLGIDPLGVASQVTLFSNNSRNVCGFQVLYTTRMICVSTPKGMGMNRHAVVCASTQKCDLMKMSRGDLRGRPPVCLGVCSVPQTFEVQVAGHVSCTQQ